MSAIEPEDLQRLRVLVEKDQERANYLRYTADVLTGRAADHERKADEIEATIKTYCGTFGVTPEQVLASEGAATEEKPQ